MRVAPTLPGARHWRWRTFVAASYVTLTFYDFFSLRTIGRRHVPYRIAVLGSFCSYAIGHNLGATVLTAGAVRWRIYSVWGLSVVDIAKRAFVTGLTFWLGNVTVLSIAMIIAPEAAGAVDQSAPAGQPGPGLRCPRGIMRLCAVAGARPRRSAPATGPSPCPTRG
jgi:hypothetical protein